MMKTILLCFTLFWVATLACEYGAPVCEWKRSKITWRCPEGQERHLCAFWGRKEGDNETCVAGVPSYYLQNLNCPGDNMKAAQAVTEWCDANVDTDGQCEVRATPRKLRIGGVKYDPCPGTFKYLRVCTSCHRPHECRETKQGLEYIGTESITNSGNICVMWNHYPFYLKYFPAASRDHVFNYCRNPDGDTDLWCFVEILNMDFEYCSQIPMCSCDVNS